MQCVRRTGILTGPNSLRFLACPGVPGKPCTPESFLKEYRTTVDAIHREMKALCTTTTNATTITAATTAAATPKQATTTIPTSRSELAEYNLVGKGRCLDSTGKYPRNYHKGGAFSTISECRDLCTTLSAACVGYEFIVSGTFAGMCDLYGSMLPDKGTGAAAPGMALDGWGFSSAGNGGSDTLTHVHALTDLECHAKQPGTTPAAATPMAATPAAATPMAATPAAATPKATTPKATTPAAATGAPCIHDAVYTRKADALTNAANAMTATAASVAQQLAAKKLRVDELRQLIAVKRALLAKCKATTQPSTKQATTTQPPTTQPTTTLPPTTTKCGECIAQFVQNGGCMGASDVTDIVPAHCGVCLEEMANQCAGATGSGSGSGSGSGAISITATTATKATTKTTSVRGPPAETTQEPTTEKEVEGPGGYDDRYADEDPSRAQPEQPEQTTPPSPTTPTNVPEVEKLKKEIAEARSVVDKLMKDMEDLKARLQKEGCEQGSLAVGCLEATEALAATEEQHAITLKAIGEKEDALADSQSRNPGNGSDGASDVVGIVVPMLFVALLVAAAVIAVLVKRRQLDPKEVGLSDMQL